MLIFQTPRLEIKSLKKEDKPFYAELLTAPEIVGLIPQPPFPAEQIDEMFIKYSAEYEQPGVADKTIWGVYEIGSPELIGLCAILHNDEGDKELGYRFRQPYWGMGFGTELTRFTIDYFFEKLDFDLLTADAWVENQGSTKILERFFALQREFYNPELNCWDRRYALTRETWSSNNDAK
ncbi:MAG: GNAT family N-acetyltransferase [Flavobacteriales bacterium]